MNRNLTLSKRRKARLILVCSTNTNGGNMAYQSFGSENGRTVYACCPVEPCPPPSPAYAAEPWPPPALGRRDGFTGFPLSPTIQRNHSPERERCRGGSERQRGTERKERERGQRGGGALATLKYHHSECHFTLRHRELWLHSCPLWRLTWAEDLRWRVWRGRHAC